jgi:hypothetical protein
MRSDAVGLLLGIVGASLATYATAWSIRRRRDDRRWWLYLLVSVGCWGYALWRLLRR